MYMYLHVHPLLRDGYLFDMCNCFFFFFVYKLSHCVGTIYLKLLLYLEKFSVL